MNKFIRFSLVIVLVITSLCIGGVYYFNKRVIPYGSGTLEMNILENVVSVTRDNEGIPHIKAKNRKDAYRALGYVIASERLFQMEVLRRLGSGTLSEIIGEKGIKIDKTFRTLGIRRLFKEKLDQGMIDKDMLKEANAFFEGVNFFINSGPRPVEFVLAGIEPTEFNILDTYSVIGYFSYAFAAFIRHDLLMDELKGKLPPELWKELQIDASSNTVMTADSKVSGDLQTIFDGFKEISTFLYGIEGSNAWAVSSKRSSSGSPILASDPHVSMSNPGIWFEAHLKVENPNNPFETYGHFIPGIPFAAMSHNKRKGWGITISYLDDMDFFKEEIIDQGNEYLFNNEKKKVRRFSETIKVKDSKDIHLPIRMTDHGPLLDEIIETKNIAMKWSLHHPLNKPLQAFWKMNEAKNFKEFKSAVSLAGAPGLNIIYADTDDNIARLNAGFYPKRAKGTDGMTVLSGRGDQEYLGYIPFEEMPHNINPSSGIVLSANNRPLKASSDITGLWQPKDRFITIYSKLHSKQKWNVKDFMTLQNNIQNTESSWMKNVVINNIEGENFTKLEQASFDILKKWDEKSSATSIGASIFHELMYFITMNSLDELDEDDRNKYCSLSARWFYLQRILKKDSGPWWDIVKTKRIETKRDILIKSFKDTVSSLESKLGPKINKWGWGELHQLEFMHAFGRSKPLSYLFNIGPIGIGGAYNEVNNLRKVGCIDGHKVKSGPSTRRVIDFKTPEKSFGILPLGNSSHKFSPYYKNQLKRFKEGKYRLQLMDDESIKKHSIGVLELLPKR
jgi:penicillin amidase